MCFLEKRASPGNYVWLFLFSCMVSICTGTFSFLYAFKWYPVAEMLRSCAVDIFILAFILLLSKKIAKYVIIILFIPLFLFSLAGVLHIAIYRSGVSAFSVMSTLETSTNEATEFLAEYVELVTALSACVTALVCMFFYGGHSRPMAR